MSKLETSEIHSEAIHEIITSVPGWIVRSGISVVLIVLTLLIILSSFISYPDIVVTNMTVSSINMPKAVVARTNGTLRELFVSNSETVKKGFIIGYIDNTADYKDMLKLDTLLLKIVDEVLRDKKMLNEQLHTPLDSKLGEVQIPYEQFYYTYTNYKDNLDGGIQRVRKEYLYKELKDIVKMRSQMYEQKSTFEHEYNIAKQQYESYKKLADKGVLARMELKAEELKFLEKKHPLHSSNQDIINNVTAYNLKKKEIEEFEDTKSKQKGLFIQALNTLLESVHKWKQSYLLISPRDGTVQFAGNIQEGRNVVSGESIFLINQKQSNYFGEIAIPQYNMGKVKVGQSVLIKLHGYPFEEYGILNGKIKYIADAPNNDTVFLAKMNFDGSHIDSRIKLRNGMKAQVEIITENSSLLQRIFRSLIKIFKN